MSPHDDTEFIYHENHDTRLLPVHENSVDLFRMEDSNIQTINQTVNQSALPNSPFKTKVREEPIKKVAN